MEVAKIHQRGSQGSKKEAGHRLRGAPLRLRRTTRILLAGVEQLSCFRVLRLELENFAQALHRLPVLRQADLRLGAAVPLPSELAL